MDSENETKTVKMEKLTEYKPKVIRNWEDGLTEVYIPKSEIEAPPLPKKKKTVWNLFGIL